jgi:hypothetical protein
MIIAMPGHAHTETSIVPTNSPIMYTLHLASMDIMFKLESLFFSRAGQMMKYSLSFFVPGIFRFPMVRRANPEIYSTQKK